MTEGNARQSDSHRIQCRERLQQALARVRQAAERDRTARFTAVWHLVADVERLREAFSTLKRQSAPGIDGETWQQYEAHLEANLVDLAGRLHRGAYHAKPVKRVYIPLRGDTPEALATSFLDALITLGVVMRWRDDTSEGESDHE